MEKRHSPGAAEIDRIFEMMFDHLYRDLCGEFDHPMEWMGLLERPAWWRRRARAAHRRVASIFATYGLVLTDKAILAFRQAEPQMPWEDAGGSIVRQLRHAFQSQTGVSCRRGMA